MLILGLIIGFIAGTFSGIAVMCFCIVAQTNDEYARRYNKEHKSNEQ
jgi:hypothetical protein